MRVGGAVVVLLLAALQQDAAWGARITRGLVGSGYGGVSGGGGGGSCKYWCESGGGQYHCCQTPEQTALQTGSHLPQTSGYGTQGVNNFGNNLGHHGGGNNLGNYGTSNNFAQQGNSFGNNFAQQGNSYGSQGSSRPQVSLVILRPQQGSNIGSHGSYRPQGTHGSQSVNPSFRPAQGGYGSNNNLASIGSAVNNFGANGFQNNNQPQGHSGANSFQNNNQPQGHSSNFVSNPSIVTPLGHNDAISHNRPINQGTIGNSNNGFNPNNFAFQGSNQGSNQGRNPGSSQGIDQGTVIYQPNNQGGNQGVSHPFDVRLRPTPKKT